MDYNQAFISITSGAFGWRCQINSENFKITKSQKHHQMFKQPAIHHAIDAIVDSLQNIAKFAPQCTDVRVIVKNRTIKSRLESFNFGALDTLQAKRYRTALKACKFVLA